MNDRNYLHRMYNATSTEVDGELETYQYWLERQLLSRIERIEELERWVEVVVKKAYNEVPNLTISAEDYWEKTRLPKSETQEKFKHQNP